MKASKFTESQIAFVLKQGEEGTPVAEVVPEGRDQPSNVLHWKKKSGGLLPSEVKRLRQLEEENGRLKRIVADLSLGKEMLQEVIHRKRTNIFQELGRVDAAGMYGAMSGQTC